LKRHDNHTHTSKFYDHLDNQYIQSVYDFHS